jgi:histidyl-tRNA synthetase
MGDMVIALLLEKYGHIPPDLDLSPAPILVTVFDKDSIIESNSLASKLRKAGLNVACYPTATKLGKQLKYAERIGVKLAIIIGPDEIANGQVGVKLLSTREQKTIPLDEAVNTIQHMLAGETAS